MCNRQSRLNVQCCLAGSRGRKLSGSRKPRSDNQLVQLQWWLVSDVDSQRGKRSLRHQAYKDETRHQVTPDANGSLLTVVKECHGALMERVDGRCRYPGGLGMGSEHLRISVHLPSPSRKAWTNSVTHPETSSHGPSSPPRPA